MSTVQIVMPPIWFCILASCLCVFVSFLPAKSALQIIRNGRKSTGKIVEIIRAERKLESRTITEIKYLVSYSLNDSSAQLNTPRNTQLSAREKPLLKVGSEITLYCSKEDEAKCQRGDFLSLWGLSLIFLLFALVFGLFAFSVVRESFSQLGNHPVVFLVGGVGFFVLLMLGFGVSSILKTSEFAEGAGLLVTAAVFSLAGFAAYRNMSKQDEDQKEAYRFLDEKFTRLNIQAEPLNLEFNSAILQDYLRYAQDKIKVFKFNLNDSLTLIHLGVNFQAPVGPEYFHMVPFWAGGGMPRGLPRIVIDNIRTIAVFKRKSKKESEFFIVIPKLFGSSSETESVLKEKHSFSEIAVLDSGAKIYSNSNFKFTKIQENNVAEIFRRVEGIPTKGGMPLLEVQNSYIIIYFDAINPELVKSITTNIESFLSI